jgi:glycosyltransferase involved in cell wall biosynthesis
MQFFQPGDADDLARAILELYEDPSRRRALVVNAAEALAPYRWARQRAIYDGVVDELLREPAA